MLENFYLIKKDEHHLLKRLKYPAFEARVDLTKELPEILDLKFLDECTAQEIANTINEMGFFLDTFDVSYNKLGIPLCVQ